MKTGIFTEQNKIELDALVETMLDRCGENKEWKNAIKYMKESLLAEADKPSITKSTALSSAISEVWHSYYASKFMDRSHTVSQAFRAAIELAKIAE